MPVITIVQGEHGPAFACHLDEEVVRIGRSGDNDVVVPDPAWSRYHAEIARAGEGWVIRDLGSRNGLRVNGRRIEGSAALASGDRISVGRTTLIFEPATVPAATTVPSSGFPPGGPELVGKSPAMRALRAEIERVGATDRPVLITGETGTGKDLVARLLHRASARSAGPFVVVDCPALASTLADSELFGVEPGVATGVTARQGRLEAAHRGTLFLDEVGDLDPGAQAKLLRFLEDRTIERVGGRGRRSLDVWILAATNRDLAEASRRGQFRLDLYHRLDVFSLHLPPLREHREDIPELAEKLLASLAGPAVKLHADALEALMAYDFPGNVRELEHELERARLRADGPEIRKCHLSREVQEGRAERGAQDDLYGRLLRGEASFWMDVAEPFLRRDLSRNDVRDLIERGWREAGGSYKKMARLFGIAADHIRLLNFLRNHRLGVGAGED